MVSSEFISGLMKSTENLNRQFVGRTDVVNIYRIITENIDFNQSTIRVTETEYDINVALYSSGVYGESMYFTPVLIWGHTGVAGVWGATKWSAGIEEAFILGHDTYAVLGTGTLGGDPISTNIIRVTNTGDTFIERFRNDAFDYGEITTADIVTSSGRCYFDNGEVYQSKTIALDNVVFASAYMEVSGLATSNISSSISFDGGTTYTALTYETVVTNSGSSLDGLRVHFLASSDADGSNTYLSKFTLRYT